MEPLDHETTVFVEKALDKLFSPDELPERQSLRTDLHGKRGMCAEAWLCLLLPVLPNLEIFGFSPDGVEVIDNFLWRAARRQKPFDLDPPFPRLELVQTDSWGMSWVYTEVLTPVFHFPAVRRIHGRVIGDMAPYDGFRTHLRLSSCPVREIIVNKGYWTGGMLEWLSMCTSLERISIWADLSPDMPDGDNDERGGRAFDAARFHRAILPFSRTLKDLHIGYGDLYSKPSLFDDEETQFGSFKRFAFLEKLKVRHENLMKLPSDRTNHAANHADARSLSESLPPSLVNLEITDMEVAHHDQLQSELLEMVSLRSEFPHLRHIALSTRSKKEDLSGLFDRLELKCKETGIKLKIA